MDCNKLNIVVGDAILEIALDEITIDKKTGAGVVQIFMDDLNEFTDRVKAERKKLVEENEKQQDVLRAIEKMLFPQSPSAILSSAPMTIGKSLSEVFRVHGVDFAKVFDPLVDVCYANSDYSFLLTGSVITQALYGECWHNIPSCVTIVTSHMDITEKFLGKVLMRTFSPCKSSYDVPDSFSCKSKRAVIGKLTLIIVQPGKQYPHDLLAYVSEHTRTQHFLKVFLDYRDGVVHVKDRKALTQRIWDDKLASEFYHEFRTLGFKQHPDVKLGNDPGVYFVSDYVLSSLPALRSSSDLQ